MWGFHSNRGGTMFSTPGWYIVVISCSDIFMIFDCPQIMMYKFSWCPLQGEMLLMLRTLTGFWRVQKTWSLILIQQAKSNDSLFIRDNENCTLMPFRSLYWLTLVRMFDLVQELNCFCAVLIYHCEVLKQLLQEQGWSCSHFQRKKKFASSFIGIFVS